MRITTETFAELDCRLNTESGSEVGFLEMLATSAYSPPRTRPPEERRNASIRTYLRTLATLWLSGHWPDEFLAPAGVAPVDRTWVEGVEDPELLTPLFVRTDEDADGQVYELQCPGGWWGITNVLQEVLPYCEANPLAALFAEELLAVFPGGSTILHLFDSAGLPHENYYFAKRVREHDPRIRFRGIDRGVMSKDCSLVRAHAYAALTSEDMFLTRLDQLRAGKRAFDHPPIPVFDQKLPMALPFDPRTAHLFTDAHRDLFPYSALIEHDSFTGPAGQAITVRRAWEAAKEGEDRILKYAGLDTARNFGGRGVVRLSTLSADDVDTLLHLVTADSAAGEPWIVQDATGQPEDFEYLTRDGETRQQPMNVKLSSFFGPSRHLATLCLASDSPTVSGGGATVLALVDSSVSQAQDATSR